MGKFLGILAVVLVVYFVITRPVAAADMAEDIGGALATAAGSLVVFTEALVGGGSDDTTSTADVGSSGSGSEDRDVTPVPTSVPGGAVGE